MKSVYFSVYPIQNKIPETRMASGIFAGGNRGLVNPRDKPAVCPIEIAAERQFRTRFLGCPLYAPKKAVHPDGFLFGGNRGTRTLDLTDVNRAL